MFTAIAFLILCKSLQALDIAVPKVCLILPYFAVGVWLLFFLIVIILKILERI